MVLNASRRGPLVLAALLALAGCGKGEKQAPGGSGTPEAAAASPGPSGPALNPGHWQSTIKIDKLDLGGSLPPQAKAAMSRSMAVDQTFSTCLTPEEAAKPSGGVINRDPACTYDGFSMSGGRISGTATCKRDGMVQTMSMAGTFGGDSYEVHIDSKAKGPGGMDMNSSMTLKARRTGPCTGKAKG